MPVRLRDLLADQGLALRARTGDLGLDRPVSWVAPTELADPTPWLDGGELVLTTGLRLRSTAAQEVFAARLAESGAAAIGFGTGLSHTQVPRTLLAQALRLGLPLLEVPYETPFLALARLVAERLTEERNSDERRLVDAHDQLTAAVLAGDPLGLLLRTLARHIGAAVAIEAGDGTVLAGTLPDEVVHRYPVRVDGLEVAVLVAAASPAGPLPYAARLIGLELVRRLSLLAARRGLLGRALAEVFAGGLDDRAAERMLACYDVELEQRQQVVLGRWVGSVLPDPAAHLGHLLWHRPESVQSALVDGALLLLTPAGEAEPVAAALRAALARRSAPGAAVTVGVGGPGAGVRGLCASYADARAALAGVTGAAGAGGTPRLADLLLHQSDPRVRQFGERLLEPLVRFDAEHRADLVGTLRRYLETDGSVAATAEQLYVHRNTVRYRLGQIEELTRRSLNATGDRAELWLALLVSERSGSAPREQAVLPGW